jgi:hypothetical protein
MGSCGVMGSGGIIASGGIIGSFGRFVSIDISVMLSRRSHTLLL